MNREDRIGLASPPTGVDHFLRAPLHLGVAALHRIKIKVGRVLARRHRRRRAAAHADAHAFAAELNQQGARRKRDLVNMCVGHRTNAARDHDGLVIAVHRTVDVLLKRAEVAAKIRATEFIVECCATYRALNHDVERGRNAIRFADMSGGHFPRLWQARQSQIRRRKSRQTGLWHRAPTGCPLVANFAACTRCSSGKRRNRGGVIVGFDFGKVMRAIRMRRIAAFCVRIEAQRVTTRKNRSVVGVRDLGALGGQFVRIANHRKQRHVLRQAVNRPTRIENFMTAMLRVRLRKHQEFHIRRVAAHLVERRDEVVNLVIRQR